MTTSDTPRTDAASISASGWEEWEGDLLPDGLSVDTNVVPIRVARQLERELNDAYKSLAVLVPGVQRMQEQLANAKAKLTAVLTDKDYEGGVQYWIRKHDELALILARLQSAESGHRAVRDAAAS